jgi:hypothetical protein
MRGGKQPSRSAQPKQRRAPCRAATIVAAVRAAEVAVDFAGARRGERVVAVIDAKYKKITGPYKNHDLYQMSSYGTSLSCPSTYLYYSATESEFEGSISVKNSPISIEIKRLDIANKDVWILQRSPQTTCSASIRFGIYKACNSLDFYGNSELAHTHKPPPLLESGHLAQNLLDAELAQKHHGN